MRRITRSSILRGQDTELTVMRPAESGRLAAKLSETAAKKKPAPQKTKSSAAKISKQPGRKVQSPKTSKTTVPVITVSAHLREKADKIQKQLHKLYPSPEIPLAFTSNFQLLIAVMLSAQTTDKKVNQVTPALFHQAPDARALASADVGLVEATIKEIGLAPTKAKNIITTAKLLIERHGGEVPRTFAELEALPGVGHKTASVVMSQCHGVAAFPVDTHIHRLAARWGLSSGASVLQTEADLKALFDVKHWNALHLQIIYFGREHCTAKSHDALKCPICSWAAQ